MDASTRTVEPPEFGLEFEIFSSDSIIGPTTDLGFDPFDGFAFFPEQSLELEFALTPSDPGAILQVCMVVPFGGPPPMCWNTTMSSGLGFATIAPGVDRPALHGAQANHPRRARRP